MNVSILPGTYLNLGGAVKITCYCDGEVEVEPVYFEDRRYRLITLTPTVAALVEIYPGVHNAIIEMLEYRPAHIMPGEPMNALTKFDNRPNTELEFYLRCRTLNKLEFNSGISAIYYSWIRDGAYDEKIRRHKNRTKPK